MEKSPFLVHSCMFLAIDERANRFFAVFTEGTVFGKWCGPIARTTVNWNQRRLASSMKGYGWYFNHVNWIEMADRGHGIMKRLACSSRLWLVNVSYMLGRVN